MNCWAGTLALQLRQEMGFYLMVFFMGLLPQNTTDMIMFYILVVLHNEHTFMTPCTSVPFLCIFSFYINFIILIIFFHCRIDLYCIKHIFSLQWHWSATFVTQRYIANCWGPQKKFVPPKCCYSGVCYKNFTVINTK